MNSHGVEISIGRCVEDMVRTQILCLFFFFFFYHVLCINNLREQRLRAALAMVKKEPHPLFFSNRHQGKSHQPKSLWYETNRTPAAQNKKSNTD